MSELGGRRPKLLLHACCAPCASAVLERLDPFFQIVIFYYNPNIWPHEEYEKRFEQFPRLLHANGMWDRVELIKCAYDADSFTDAARGLESEPEGGARCPGCFGLRLRKTASEARELGAEFFATTLTVSPHKNASLINGIGSAVALEAGVRWLPSDFKKKDGYLRSIRLSEQFGLYRQDYCGCQFARSCAPEEPEGRC